MTVFKRSDLFDSTQSLLQLLDSGKDLVALGRIARCALGFGKIAQFGVDLLGFGERIKQPGKERPFLRRNLGGRCIVCNR